MDRSLSIHGIPIFRGTRGEFEAMILDRLRDGSGLRMSFVNTEMIVQSFHDRDLWNYLKTNHINVPDSAGVLVASWFSGRPVKQRIAGPDMLNILARVARRFPFRLFLLGGRSGVAERAASMIRARFPEITVVGTHDGFDARQRHEIAEEIRAAETDFLMVCMGSPRQERWIGKHLDASGARIAVGNGGAVDYWGGRVRRAPQIVRACGFEWLYRLIHDFSPARLGRVFRVFAFPAYLFLSWMSRCRR